MEDSNAPDVIPDASGGIKTSGKMGDVHAESGYGWVDELALVMIAEVGGGLGGEVELVERLVILCNEQVKQCQLTETFFRGLSEGWCPSVL